MTDERVCTHPQYESDHHCGYSKCWNNYSKCPKHATTGSRTAICTRLGLPVDSLHLDAVFLDWMAARLVNVYGESENVDFVRKLRAIAKTLPENQSTPWL